MMRLSKNEIARRAEEVVARAKASPVRVVTGLRPATTGQSPVPTASKEASSPLTLDLCDGESVIGGGAAPSAVLPTRLIALSHANLSADELNTRLRASIPPIIARVEDGRVLLDLRTVFPEQDANLATALASLV
jgi:seryl-tRNA(Sec) selenium transferase